MSMPAYIYTHRSWRSQFLQHLNKLYPYNIKIVVLKNVETHNKDTYWNIQGKTEDTKFSSVTNSLFPII